MDRHEAPARRRPTLIDDAEVEQLVRGFAARVLFLRAAFHAGEPGAGNPLETIDHDAGALSAALALTVHGAAYWRYLLPEETKQTGDPGAALGLWMAAQLVQMMQSVENGEPEDAIKPTIEAMLADVVARLVGAKH
ncbi:hypothetical protein [Paraburkholderia heleia]|uniref:hypothetical protein n=1 Tax=Paraburkholderia heleia TaxID=634127 RepID=UPI0005AB3491|nr:hypothetical protein [Paraburkholderia heleia]